MKPIIELLLNPIKKIYIKKSYNVDLLLFIENQHILNTRYLLSFITE